MAFGIQNKYPIDILRYFYKLTGTTEVSKKNDLQCECGKPGCGTLHEVELDTNKQGQEHNGIYCRKASDSAEGEAEFCNNHTGETEAIPDSMWVGTDCVTEFTPECEELNAINEEHKVISLATYLKRTTTTDAELLAMYRKSCFQNQAPSWARLGNVPDIMRKAGRLNTLVNYLITPNAPNACALLNVIVKAVSYETNDVYYVKVAQDLAKQPYAHKFGSLMASVSFMAGRRPSIHVQGYKVEDLTSQLEAALTRIEELEAAQTTATR